MVVVVAEQHLPVVAIMPVLAIMNILGSRASSTWGVALLAKLDIVSRAWKASAINCVEYIISMVGMVKRGEQGDCRKW